MPDWKPIMIDRLSHANTRKAAPNTCVIPLARCCVSSESSEIVIVCTLGAGCVGQLLRSANLADAIFIRVSCVDAFHRRR